MGKALMIVEDEAMLRQTMAELLAGEGYEVLQADNGKTAYEIAQQRSIDIVLTDVRMPDMDGLTLLNRLRELAPQTAVIIVTAYGTVQDAVDAMQAGASDYLLKPVQFDDMLLRIRRALEFQQMSRTTRIITEQLAAESVFHNLVGRSPGMVRLFDAIRKLSSVKSNVLITGESGTGKELFARAIHYNGLTRDKPFVPVNCGAIPETLIESELFGHRRGAFTGASRDKVGYFEAADGGTLFLDEISTLPLGVQSSLLRVLEDRVVVPVGDTRPVAVDVRIISASNQDLGEMAKHGLFRQDLYYRLNVVNLTLPPLRQRREDIPLLVLHFLDKYSRQMGKHVQGLSNAAMTALMQHEWRGNVRELENVIERAMIFADGQIDLEHLPFATQAGPAEEAGESLSAAMRQYERQHILACLRRHDYNKMEAARSLSIGVSSLYRKLEELGIPKNAGEDRPAGQSAGQRA